MQIPIRPLAGFSICLVVLVGLSSCAEAQPAQSKQTGDKAKTSSTIDPLEELNESFHRIYAQTRALTLEAARPVILVEGDDLVLIDGDRREVYNSTPRQYHLLKMVDHVPLAVFVLVWPTAGKPLPVATADELKQFRARLESVQGRLADYGFAPATLGRQKQILATVAGYIDSLKVGETVAPDALTAMCRSAEPAVMQNVAEAARARLDAIDAQVQAWRRTLGPDKWENARVVVMTSHTVREGNLAAQYFRKLLGPDCDDRQLVCAEGVFEEPRALNVLGTVLLDGQIGEAFFADRARMYRDLLSDAARDYLRDAPIAR